MPLPLYLVSNEEQQVSPEVLSSHIVSSDDFFFETLSFVFYVEE